MSAPTPHSLVSGTASPSSGRPASPSLEGALREWIRAVPLVEASYHRARGRLIELFEREYLSWVLSRAGSQLSRAARLAGVDRTTLYRMMERRGLRGARGDGESGDKEPSRSL